MTRRCHAQVLDSLSYRALDDTSPDQRKEDGQVEGGAGLTEAEGPEVQAARERVREVRDEASKVQEQISTAVTSAQTLQVRRTALCTCSCYAILGSASASPRRRWTCTNQGVLLAREALAPYRCLGTAPQQHDGIVIGRIGNARRWSGRSWSTPSRSSERRRSVNSMPSTRSCVVRRGLMPPERSRCIWKGFLITCRQRVVRHTWATFGLF